MPAVVSAGVSAFNGVRAPMMGIFSRSSVLVSDCSGYCASRKYAVARSSDRANSWETERRFELMPVITSTMTRSCVNAVIGGLRPIHVDVEFRITLALLDAHVHCIGHLRDLLPDLFRHRANDIEAGSFHLNIDRRPQAEIQHIADDAAGLKSDLYAGKIRLEFLA